MSSKISRRTALRHAGAALAAGFTVRASFGAAKAKVVVIGGGAGGATVARYVARSDAVDVTLVEAKRRYGTCFFSNLYLGGFRSLESITHGYDALAGAGVRIIHVRAVAVDAQRREVRLADGQRLTYDRLVLAPGIELSFDAIEGYGQEAATRMPHAYQGGEQTALLRRQIEAMSDGGLVVIAPPANPYRCPPGPYERASMIAHYLQAHKPRSKILILDAKPSFAKQALFEEAWQRFYPEMIEWLPEEMTGGVSAVDVKRMAVRTEDEWIEAAVVNIIAPQSAGDLARLAGATDASGWCPVAPRTLASTQLPDVHLVGDAIIPGDMPKSAFSANSQAKVCASALLAELTGARVFEPRFRNTCWSLLASDHGVKVGASYEVRDGGIKKTHGFISKTGEGDATRAATASEGNDWYAAITADIFA